MLSRSRWATRGWTYQEQILCKRAVIFIDSGFFWHCHCCVWDGVDLLPGQAFEGIALRADMGQRLNTRWWPDFSLYLDLICPYNGRDFSYPQDAMLGISGVLNALRKSFLGGFICGLPRLFLDHALLWQPFGTAGRRVDRTEDSIMRSSLPSWSWCGWQCYVDPWRFRSGLTYINEVTCQRRGRSWRTKHLVEWYLSTSQGAESIQEPLLLDQLIDVADSNTDELPEGWASLVSSDVGLRSHIANTGPAFVHAMEPRAYFTHPIPICTESSTQRPHSTSTYLTCSTTTATLTPATILIGSQASSYAVMGPSKISVFEERMFKNGPNEETASTHVS
jgi:hypothetical protein